MKKTILAIAALAIGIGLFFSINLDKSLEELKPIYTNQYSHFIDIDGMSVHYRDEGLPAGSPTMVLIHGSNASLHTWEGWVKELKDQYRIISLDFPGHGLTGPHPNKQYDWPYTATFLKSLTEKLELNQFVIAGNSRGGAIAWNYAVLYPHDVSHLILVDSAGIPWQESLPFILQLQATPGINTITEYITPKWVVTNTVEQVYGDTSKVTEEKVQLYFDMTLREGNRGANNYRLSQPGDYSLLPKLSELNIPTLILWGEKDTWILPKYANLLKERIPNSRVIIYPDLGHVPMEEAPKRTVNDVVAFIGNNQ